MSLLLRFFSFFQFFDKSVGPTDGFVDDGVDGIITEITVCTPASDDGCHGCIKECRPLLLCSFSIISILRYYNGNNEKKSLSVVGNAFIYPYLAFRLEFEKRHQKKDTHPKVSV